MSDAQPMPAPGWYDDPGGGGRRWWDGNAWTNHRRPAPAPLPPLASFGQRAGAWLIDSLLLSIPALVLVGAVVLAAFVPVLASAGPGEAPEPELLAGLAVLLPLLLVGSLAVFVLNIVYWVGFEGPSGGQTIGKWALGIRVVGEDGRPVDRRAAIIRTVIKVFGSGQVVLGYLWALWEERNRTWHDLACNSLVVVDPAPKRSFSELRRSFTLRAQPSDRP